MTKCSPVNLLHIFRTPFIKNTSGRLLLSLADREPVLPKILTKAIQKNYKIKEMEEVPFFQLSLLQHMFDDKCVFDNPFNSALVCLEKCLSCNNVTGSIADSTIIDINVWPSDRNDIIDLESLFQGTFCCDFDMHGRKHCISCVLQTNRLNLKSLVKTAKVLIVATNQCHNEQLGQLTRTCLLGYTTGT